MQLGGEKETIEQTQIGAIQMLRVSAGALGPIVDDINVVNMPFLFKNTAHASKMMDGPIGQELLDKITANANADLVGAVLDGFRRAQHLQHQEADQDRSTTSRA